MDDDRCNVRDGAPRTQCTRNALPGMVVCGEHATRDAMAMHIRALAKALEARGGDPVRPHEAPVLVRAVVLPERG